jgi:signal transduction histidine kinase
MFLNLLKRITPALLLLFLVQAGHAAEPVRVRKGVLDLRHIEQGDQFSIKMNGEWEFFFSRFIYRPEEITRDSLKADCYGQVPGYWSDYIVRGSKLPRFGFGTYRAVILLPSGYRDRMGFEVPAFDTSFEMAINGVTVARNGTPGRNREESIPAYEPLFFSYTPVKDTLDILIRTSNYEHRRGGFWMPARVGTFRTIQTNFTNQWFISISVSGILVASFLFFFIFFLYDRRSPKLLMFSILALCLALRPFMSPPYLISILDVRNWLMIVRAEYLNLYLMVTAGAWLVYFIYPTPWFRKLCIFFDVIFVACVALMVTTPVYVFSYSVWVIQGLAFFIVSYALVMSIRGTFRKNWTDLVYLIAILTIGAGLIADIMLSNAMEENQRLYIMSFTMMIFVFIQATLLIREWVRSGRDREKLALQLEELNRDLENRVEKRTRELKEKSDELNARNAQIETQNRKLSETISLKNKVFSVISHDLRSPVVNILYTLHMLKDEEFRDKTETLANSCIQSSQMLISLLENMLVWGRGQEDMIRYLPAENDLSDIVLTNMSILKDTADRKNISLNFTQVGRSKGWFDRDLVDIVVRNLLSNAIKYTGHGGKVTINVKGHEDTGEGITIRICDNGVGISQERQRRLFTGTDIDSTPGTDYEKGTGIGLKLVYELVNISRGTITIESTPGLGSCFTVTLPGMEKSAIAREIF